MIGSKNSTINKNRKSALNQSRASNEEKDEPKEFPFYFESFENSFKKDTKNPKLDISAIQNQKSITNIHD